LVFRPHRAWQWVEEKGEQIPIPTFIHLLLNPASIVMNKTKFNMASQRNILSQSDIVGQSDIMTAVKIRQVDKLTTFTGAIFHPHCPSDEAGHRVLANPSNTCANTASSN
jgi:hemoglobin-like flavoprotein